MGPHQYHLHQVELLVDIYVDFRSRQMDDLEEFVESFKKQIPGTFGLISVIRKDNSAIFKIHFGFVFDWDTVRPPFPLPNYMLHDQLKRGDETIRP